LSDDHLAHVRALNDVAAGRSQTLAQLALQWALRDERMTSLVIGASSVAQLQDNVNALQGPILTQAELAAIEPNATDAGINLWAASSSA